MGMAIVDSNSPEIAASVTWATTRFVFKKVSGFTPIDRVE